MERNAFRESEVKDWPEGRPQGFGLGIEIWNILYSDMDWKKGSKNSSNNTERTICIHLCGP